LVSDFTNKHNHLPKTYDLKVRVIAQFEASTYQVKRIRGADAIPHC